MRPAQWLYYSWQAPTFQRRFQEHFKWHPRVHTGCTPHATLRRQPDDAPLLLRRIVTVFRGVPGKKASDHRGCLDVVLGHRMGIPVERDRRIGVTEARLDRLHVDAVGEQLGRLRVPQLV